MSLNKLIPIVALLAVLPACDGPTTVVAPIDLFGGGGWGDMGDVSAVDNRTSYNLRGDYLLWTGPDSSQFIVDGGYVICFWDLRSSGERITWRLHRPDGSVETGQLNLIGSCGETGSNTYWFTSYGASDTLTATFSDGILTKQLPPKASILTAIEGRSYYEIPADVVLPDSMPVATYARNSN